MHIPDGYLSPYTSGAMYAASLPFLVRASRNVKKVLNSRMIPLISVFSALSFVIMMFNIPLPGGTTGHATGIAISAIVLGPWASILSATVALVIQALFFGDGGILSLGANIFNMGIVMSLTGYFLYRLLVRSKDSARKKIVIASISGYISVNIAALLTAVELGIQPMLYKNSLGQALYFPYNLYVSVPVMMIGHLTIAGLAEGIVTGLVFAWILRVQPDLIFSEGKSLTSKKLFKFSFLGLIFLILLTPLGLLAPGTAWGEWGREELALLGLSYIPAGFDKWSSFWRAPIPDYDIPGILNPTLLYIFSACLGVLLTGLFIFFLLSVINKLGGKKKSNHE
ncbi:cobalamin biosynthesis protein CbiM [Candidatus Gottesmanbacteria bacterium CG11_big_fil_rev_8_21_14_0_20_37_11]|uniref:Cobalamin biosynthesis protein CbiM n=3 Tax=Candidatus Gottesmaniibacteriota TaxID=1752720 RepID=A0A2M7RPW4_9BACT|nr:MAG: hypothetical protein AUJ73_01080 [Candidatus Gottesmanbacteria bacterium CG1_02_37_22]PIP32972.1 MAG: cobalamin biosynthesis protein CbiM [Candidatus Gottesmanbacteria bacterium CG23_combo_of_CG06-09_8_20_14_all_37_19]PIR07769.1 MAG: cobalamin biosynthesis protein CbiM [Candidatus Gottesmanbacteria bacterium CG11_big_fil_rev_8_21_14_0_20_37_11]PIZ02366.1 MAG: cobalamin biosynthesis protein CbiM [Candidatus Gottesmanbacteria bacterium CG_4_10_14_0_8_um_filter_37_24]